MCICESPTVNGQVGYRWNDPQAAPGIYPVNAPELRERDVLLYDLPGRCGGVDSHSYHYRITAGMSLLVRHGGGEERIDYIAGRVGLKAVLAALDDNGRYWIANAIYHAYSEGRKVGRQEECTRWRLAAVDKRIKVRKIRGRDAVNVTITSR